MRLINYLKKLILYSGKPKFETMKNKELNPTPKDKRDYEKNWSGLPIKFLIVATNDYIVFLDDDYDLDWKTSDTFDSKEESEKDKKLYYSVKNEIDCADSTPINHLDDTIVLAYKRKLGEALVRAFEGDYENARAMVKMAQDFIFKRNVEQSRFLFLTSSGMVASITLLIFIILWFNRDFFILNLGQSAFYVTLSSSIGGIGALLSVILRMGKSNIDYNASKKLHYLEGASRIVAGSISALIVSLCIRAQIILPIFNNIESTHIAMVLGGLISGASERFAPSIINKLDGTSNKYKL